MIITFMIRCHRSCFAIVIMIIVNYCIYFIHKCVLFAIFSFPLTWDIFHPVFFRNWLKYILHSHCSYFNKFFFSKLLSFDRWKTKPPFFHLELLERTDVLLVIITSSVGNSVKTKESVTVNQSLWRCSMDHIIDHIDQTLMHELLLHCCDRMPIRNHLWEEGFISEGFKGFIYRGKGDSRAVVADGGENIEKEAFGEAQGVCVCAFHDLLPLRTPPTHQKIIIFLIQQVIDSQLWSECAWPIILKKFSHGHA